MFRFRRQIICGTFITLSTLAATIANADQRTFVLARVTLQNVVDTAGLWQYEGGTLESNTGGALGTYSVVRRVTTGGTDTYNVADEKITLFFAPSAPSSLPEVIAFEGVHSFSTGNFAGSVSAASRKFHFLVGAEGSTTIPSSTTTDLVLTYLGTNPF